MVITSFCALVVAISPAQTLQVTYLKLDVRIACNGLQQKFQHAEYFTCNPLISQPIFIRSSNSFHHYSWWCDGAIIISIELKLASQLKMPIYLQCLSRAIQRHMGNRWHFRPLVVEGDWDNFCKPYFMF